MAVRERKGGRTGVVKQKQKEEPKGEELSGSGLYGEWLIEDETRTGVKKPRRAKRSMKDLRNLLKFGEYLTKKCCNILYCKLMQ